MKQPEPLDKELLKKKFIYLRNECISKESLLEGMSSINKNYSFNNTIIAMFDISKNSRTKAKSLVFDLKEGVLLSDKSTKQLINGFVNDSSIDFHSIRALMSFFNMKRNIPLITGLDTYMPLQGATRNVSDWISLNWVESYRVKDGEAVFKTSLGFDIKFDFKGLALTKRIHDTAFLAECTNLIVQNTCKKMGYKINTEMERGIITEFELCGCDLHKNIESVSALEVKKISHKMILSKIHDLPELELMPNLKKETTKSWSNQLKYYQKIW